MWLLTANRSDEEPFRIERLERFERSILASALGDIVRNQIWRLHDHKGTLTVYWREKAEKSYVRSVADAWNVLEGEPNTEHLNIDPPDDVQR